MKKIRIAGSVAVVAALLVAQSGHASIVNVFLDDGTQAPGSSNSSQPAFHPNWGTVWDVSSTAENGLSAIGAAVMEVSMDTFNVNGNMRRSFAQPQGLGVETGASPWNMDGGTREAASFQLKFYSDAAKTTEITGVNVTLDSVMVYVVGGDMANARLDAFASSGTYSVTARDNGGLAQINGANMHASQDTGFADLGEDRTMYPAITSGSGFFTMNPVNAGITFTENDVFWVRRVGTDGGYRLANVAFDVVPEPATLGLFALIGGGLLWVRKHF